MDDVYHFELDAKANRNKGLEEFTTEANCSQPISKLKIGNQPENFCG